MIARQKQVVKGFVNAIRGMSRVERTRLMNLMRDLHGACEMFIPTNDFRGLEDSFNDAFNRAGPSLEEALRASLDQKSSQ
jgi:hypothetical protein